MCFVRKHVAMTDVMSHLSRQSQPVTEGKRNMWEYASKEYFGRKDCIENYSFVEIENANSIICNFNPMAISQEKLKISLEKDFLHKHICPFYS